MKILKFLGECGSILKITHRGEGEGVNNLNLREGINEDFCFKSYP
jgi:hypothetical protein